MFCHRLLRSKCIIVSVFLFGVVLILDSHKEQSRLKELEFYYDESEDVSKEVPSLQIITHAAQIQLQDHIKLQTFMREVTPSTTDNIFLMETSNSSRSVYLKYRVLCSVESWCSANPSYEVWLLVNSDRIWDRDGLVRRLLRVCTNLDVVRLEPKLILSGTPMMDLYMSKRFKNTLWPASHLSDLLRLSLLWKFGGMYADSDTVCLKTVAGLSNVVGLGAQNRINSAVMHFEKGHPFVKRCMRRLYKDYWPKRYITTVLAVQHEVMVSCRVTDKELHTLPGADPNPCKNFTVLTTRAFFPIQWNWNMNIFAKGSAQKFDEKLNGSYVLHIGSGKTFNKSVVLGKRTIYEKAAIKFCPSTYKDLWTRSMFF